MLFEINVINDFPFLKQKIKLLSIYFCKNNSCEEVNKIKKKTLQQRLNLDF